jgi:hypothetical protein
MDEMMVFYRTGTPETKKQSQQWIKKGQWGPTKAKVHASWTRCYWHGSHLYSLRAHGRFINTIFITKSWQLHDTAEDQEAGDGALDLFFY